MGSTPSKINLNEVSISPLDPQWDRADFCCGHKSIDNFFINSAKDHHKKHKARVYGAVYRDVVIGYYFLVAQSTPPGEISKEAVKKFSRVDETPCVYLGMLGVREAYTRNGVGKVLMVHAMKKTLEVANLIGIYALTLEADNKEVGEFYKNLGFEYFIEGDLAMYLPIGTIKKVLG